MRIRCEGPNALYTCKKPPVEALLQSEEYEDEDKAIGKLALMIILYQLFSFRYRYKHAT